METLKQDGKNTTKSQNLSGVIEPQQKREVEMRLFLTMPKTS